MNPVLSPTVTTSSRGAETSPVEVSVCIANWNRRELLRACLTSVLRSVDVALEVIVVDNGSLDGSATLVEREFPTVRLLRQATNLGFARANNLAAEAARGHFLFFLNNDTEVAPETLSLLVDRARAQPDLGVLAPLLRNPEGRPQLSCRRPPTVGMLLSRLALVRWTGFGRRAYQGRRGRDRDLSRTVPVEVVMGAALLVTRTLFRDCGGWDESFTFGGEDIDLCTRIGRQHAVVFYPDAEVLHHGRASSRDSGGYAYLHTRLGMIRYLRKHANQPWALALYKALLALDLPLQTLVLLGHYLWRRCWGRHAEAARSRNSLRDVLHFLRHGLPLLWKA